MSPNSKENEDTIRRFVEAWSRLDAAELASYFTEDGTYHNMPTAPIIGRAQIERFIQGFSASWTATTWDLINIAVDGDRVFTERLDRTKAGEKGVDLPCLGVFEMEDGKIKVWRDYFDMATFAGGMS